MEYDQEDEFRFKNNKISNFYNSSKNYAVDLTILDPINYEDTGDFSFLNWQNRRALMASYEELADFESKKTSKIIVTPAKP